jgi:hypothetical protein
VNNARTWQRAVPNERIGEVVRQGRIVNGRLEGVVFVRDPWIPGVLAYQVRQFSPASALGAVGPELKSDAEVTDALVALINEGMQVEEK